MTLWDWLHSLGPGWPRTERAWVTFWVFIILMSMLTMAWIEPSLWQEERFNTILQAVAITGLINMVLAFHFSANQGQQEAHKTSSDAIAIARQALDRPVEEPKEQSHADEVS